MPISLLPSQKFVKKIIFEKNYSFFDDNKLVFFYKSQYGFRKEYSTEFAALELIYKLVCQMDKIQIPITIFFRPF